MARQRQPVLKRCRRSWNAFGQSYRACGSRNRKHKRRFAWPKIDPQAFFDTDTALIILFIINY